MAFRNRGLDVDAFQALAGLTDTELHARGARRVVADATPGFPDRIEGRDAEPGEPLLLVNYTHRPAAGPYRAAHAIFVLEHPTEAFDRIDEIPSVLRNRVISLRAFDAEGLIVAAELCPGADLEGSIDAQFKG